MQQIERINQIDTDLRTVEVAEMMNELHKRSNN